MTRMDVVRVRGSHLATDGATGIITGFSTGPRNPIRVYLQTPTRFAGNTYQYSPATLVPVTIAAQPAIQPSASDPSSGDHDPVAALTADSSSDDEPGQPHPPPVPPLPTAGTPPDAPPTFLLLQQAAAALVAAHIDRRQAVALFEACYDLALHHRHASQHDS